MYTDRETFGQIITDFKSNLQFCIKSGFNPANRVENEVSAVFQVFSNFGRNEKNRNKTEHGILGDVV